jgi:hypothetical protein
MKNLLSKYTSFLFNEVTLSRAFWLYGNVILGVLIIILILLGLILSDDLRNFVDVQKFTSIYVFKKIILKSSATLVIVYTFFITYIIFKAASRYQGARKYFYGAKIIAAITALLTIKDIIKYFF